MLPSSFTISTAWLGDHKHVASAMPTPILKTCSATEREEKADLGQITFPRRIICFWSSAPLASPLWVWTHDMFFMDEQVRLAPHEVQGRRITASAGDNYTFFMGPLSYECTIHLCFASLYKIKYISKKDGKSMPKETEPKKSSFDRKVEIVELPPLSSCH